MTFTDAADDDAIPAAPTEAEVLALIAATRLQLAAVLDAMTDGPTDAEVSALLAAGPTEAEVSELLDAAWVQLDAADDDGPR